jgi:short-subunit dehydrogenase
MKKDSLVLGGSRGLGRSIVNLLGSKSYSVSRSQSPSVDFSKPESIEKLKKIIDKNSDLETIFYCAGGGPHGDFFSKPVHSHKWAFEVNFLRPIELVYYLIEKEYKGTFIYIGSCIAERSDSLNSLSYASSKKLALKSLLSIKDSSLKIRVFSPPYMDTQLLPAKSWPRQENPELVLDPDKVAKTLLEWLPQDLDHTGVSDPRHFDWMERFSYSLPEGKEI